jgi:hypothetical protein
LNGADGLTFGPDGNLYVVSFFTASVLRYNGSTGAFLGVFAAHPALTLPEGLAFGRDGNLYVGSRGTASVLRFNGVTGAFINVFVPTASGGLSDPVELLFGHDGNLLVASEGTASVLRYDGTTGAFLGAFVASGSGGLFLPRGMAFGADANLVADDVRRCCGTTARRGLHRHLRDLGKRRAVTCHLSCLQRPDFAGGRDGSGSA